MHLRGCTPLAGPKRTKRKPERRFYNEDKIPNCLVSAYILRWIRNCNLVATSSCDILSLGRALTVSWLIPHGQLRATLSQSSAEGYAHISACRCDARPALTQPTNHKGCSKQSPAYLVVPRAPTIKLCAPPRSVLERIDAHRNLRVLTL
jgi:hypothetical protein